MNSIKHTKNEMPTKMGNISPDQYPKVLTFNSIHLSIAVLIALSSVLSVDMQAQEGPQIIPPTPDAAKIAQFIETPTSLYTGSQNFSVPLHTIRFDGISIPISINYHSGGIRANEDASMVGLGWALNGAGSISRTVKGYNDFRPNGYVNNFTLIATGPVTNYDENGDWEIVDQSYYDHLTLSSYVDTEPDVFTYNFLGSSGMFVLSKKEDINDVIEVIKIKENPDKIEFNPTGKYFTVKSPNGFEGTFDIHEYTLGLGGNASGPLPLPGGVFTNPGLGDGCSALQVNINQAINDEKRAITTWHLSKIESPNGLTLDFEYLHQPGVHSDYISVSADRFGDYMAFYSNMSISGSGGTETCSKNIYEHVYLSKISSTDTGLRVLFNMTSRLDIEPLTEGAWKSAIAGDRNSGSITSLGAQRIASISVYNDLSGSSLNKSINFNHGYFNNSYIGDPEAYSYLRLKLEGLTIDDQKYDFEYLEEGVDLPNKSTKGIDYWGYYNGQANDYLYPGLEWLQPVVLGLGWFQMSTNQNNYYQSDARKADFSYGQAGLLNKVTYPTGGSTIYDYESHDYKLTGEEYIPPVGGGSAFASGIGGTSTDDFSYIGAQLIDLPGGGVLNNPAGCPVNVDVTFRVMCKDYYLIGSTPCPIDVADRTTVAVELFGPSGTLIQTYAYDQLWGPGLNFFEETLAYEGAGTYTIKAHNIVDSNGDAKYYGQVSVSYSSLCDPDITVAVNSTEYNQVAGGARIAAITSYDETKIATLKRSYEYKEDGPAVFSSGKLMNPLLHVYSECNKIPLGGEIQCVYYSVSGDNLIGSGAAQGSHIGYSSVKETFEDPNSSSTNGFKRYFYENQSNIFADYGEAPVRINNRQNGTLFQEFTPGPTSKVVEYNDNFDVVGNPIHAIALKGTGINQIGILDYYDITRMFITPKEIVQTESYPTGSIVNTTNRTFNTRFQLSAETTIDSQGKTIESSFKYPYDLTAPSGGVYDQMKDKNILIPVEQITKVDGGVVAATGTKYKVDGSNIVPDEVYTFNQDLGAFSSTSDGINFGGGYEMALQYVNYNSVSGKLEEYVGRDGINNVFIWGYDLNYPVAKISNASKSDITGLGLSLDAGSGGLSALNENTLRTLLPDAFVTTYTYDPGKGIITQTDPNNLTTTYEYDESDRLKLVKDHEGNIVSHNDYNYINK